ncbi:hypothetical protein ACSBR2_017886 [Camellia fascicularis]
MPMIIFIRISSNFHGSLFQIRRIHLHNLYKKAHLPKKYVKDALLTDESKSYQNNLNHEETILYLDNVDTKWMVDPWEIKDRYIHNQNFIPHFDQYRYIYEAMLKDTTSVDFTHHYVE